MKAILVFPLSQTCNKFCEFGKLTSSFVRSWAETVHVLPLKLFTTSTSVKATALQWNDEPKETFENINKALCDDSIPKGCTHKCNDWWSSCTVYQCSIVPRVDVSTATPHPYAPFKCYRAIFTYPFTPLNKNYTETYKCTQALTVQTVTSEHIHANTSAQTYFM